MKLASLTIPFLALGTLLFACASREQRTPTNDYEKFVAGVMELQNRARSQYTEEDDTYYCDLDFEKYFSHFDKLSIDSLWTLESHYRYFGDAGRPLLLAFEKNDSVAAELQSRLATASQELRQGTMDDWNLSKQLFDYQDSVDYTTPIRVSTDSGYFQLLVFALIGDNYCLYWHSNYGHLDIVTSKQSIQGLTERDDHPYYAFSDSERSEALSIDPVPTVDMHNGDSVSIRIVTFEPWDGFIEQKFSITTTWPHRIRQLERTVLVAYDCGILF